MTVPLLEYDNSSFFLAFLQMYSLIVGVSTATFTEYLSHFTGRGNVSGDILSGGYYYLGFDS